MQFHLTYKCKISRKLILRIVHIAFFMIWLMLEIFIQKIIQKHWHLQHWIHCNKKIDDYANINSVNSVRPLYLIIGKVCRYFEENNGNKYSVFTSTNNKKNLLAKFTNLFYEIKHLNETINEGKKGEYKENFMKIKFVRMIIYL